MEDFYLDSQNMVIAKNRKSILSITIYNNDDRRLFLEFCHSEKVVRNYLAKNNIQWTHAMIYHRKTKEKIARIYNN